MASPRDLDPKFRNEPETAKQDETPDVETDTRPQPVTVDGDESQIVFRQYITNPDGTAGEKIHGPMPRSEWATYEKENGL